MLDYKIGSIVEMKKPHACTVKATGKKPMLGKLQGLGLISKLNVQTATMK